MTSLKWILIVDDHEVNRRILNRILEDHYHVLAAENGRTALDALTAHAAEIAAIMLDLQMPVMDGYEFLAEIGRHPEYQNIPVLVTTGNSDREHEKEALKLGAWDFISKPYDADIINFRIKNAIDRSQLSAFHQLKYLAEYDTLTDSYNKKKFFEVTAQMLLENRQQHFVFIRFDINRFSLVNSFFGTSVGDSLLKASADGLARCISGYAFYTSGRIEADTFAFCIPYYSRENVLGVLDNIKNELHQFELNFDIVPTFGIFVVEDPAMPVDLMFDRANLAAKKCKGNYVTNYAFYNREMREEIEREQMVTNEMNQALAEHQFVVFLQPQYRLEDNRPSGAEALVRWKHPVRGVISPAEFIPVFERNGFISKLDRYMWEEVCRLLRTWMDKGLKPWPISVNVSRVNLYDPHLVPTLCGLIEKYEIPAELLQLELTESAYTDNPAAIASMVNELHKHGFVIFMDDFGSGYSSLNVLKDVAVDVLKIDMKFLTDSAIVGRSENIVASVVRMAKWLNMPVVAEGVEKKEQVSFLRSIGCEYVQGYFFARPMPVDQYEQLVYLSPAAVFDKSENSARDIDILWAATPQMEILFSNIPQAAAIYEYEENRVEVLRVNEAYYDMFGYDAPDVGWTNTQDRIDPENLAVLLNAFDVVSSTKGVSECEYLWKRTDERMIWVHAKLKFITGVGSKSVIMGSLSDISMQKKIDGELQKYRSALEKGHRKSRILVVDDMEINRAVLKSVFTGQYDVLEAENGRDAIGVLDQCGGVVDIILLDLQMPVMDGLEFLHYKKTRKDLDSIPVVIITADDSPQQQVETLAIGANDYIVKPFIPELVRRRVCNVLESKNQLDETLNGYSAVLDAARRDDLTGLYNRSTAHFLMINALENFSDSAMLMLDIDNFKEINDTYGHPAGDRAIRAFAAYLTGLFRKSDIVARYGGDEFAVFLSGIPSVEFIHQRCAALIAHTADIPNVPVHLECSIGASLCSSTNNDIDQLIEQADKALYAAKNKGKNQYAVYQEMN